MRLVWFGMVVEWGEGWVCWGWVVVGGRKWSGGRGRKYRNLLVPCAPSSSIVHGCKGECENFSATIVPFRASLVLFMLRLHGVPANDVNALLS